MRILLVTDLYPLNNSSEPTTIKNFAKKWKESGHIVDVIRPNFIFNTIVRKKKLFPQRTYEQDGITIYNINCITPFLFDIKNKLPEDFKIGNYSLVISHMPSGALFAMKLIRKCAGIPYVVSVHSSDIAVLTKPVYKLFFSAALQKAYKRADAISARSYMLAEKIKEISPFAVNKTFVAPSGVNPAIIESEEFFENKQKNSPLVISTTAKLIKRKNVDIVLKALVKLKNKNFIYKIMGDGSELKNLKNLMKQLNLEDKVLFEGNISNKRVLENLSKSDIFILLSTGETFGMAYLEAMARGNIVIASKNDGLDGFIKDGENGFLCEPDENKLAELLDTVINLPNDEFKNLLFRQRNFIQENDETTAALNYLNKITDYIN